MGYALHDFNKWWGMIVQAKALIERSFTEEMRQFWTEGSIETALKLCIRADVFVMTTNSLLAGFRYWPNQRQIVEDMDWFELERANLSNGPLLHIVAFIAPRHGYELFRKAVSVMNPWGVTAHRFTKGEWRFTARRNVRFEDKHGQFRRQQEQAKV